MQVINIKLDRCQREDKWSVEIDGRLHDHVSATDVDELVEYAIVAAQESLLHEETRTRPIHLQLAYVNPLVGWRNSPGGR